MGRAFSLYEQMKAIEFFQKGLRKETVLVVDPGKGLFRYLKDNAPASESAPQN